MHRNYVLISRSTSRDLAIKNLNISKIYYIYKNSSIVHILHYLKVTSFGLSFHNNVPTFHHLLLSVLELCGKGEVLDNIQ